MQGGVHMKSIMETIMKFVFAPEIKTKRPKYRIKKLSYISNILDNITMTLDSLIQTSKMFVKFLLLLCVSVSLVRILISLFFLSESTLELIARMLF